MVDAEETWAAGAFGFQVDGLGAPATFEEAIGLASRGDFEVSTLADAGGARPRSLAAPSPRGRVLLQNGVLMRTFALWVWLSAIKLKTLPRRTIIVSLIDPAGAPDVTWTLEEAVPIKVGGASSAPNGVDVALVTLEVAFERLTMTYAGAAQARLRSRYRSRSRRADPRVTFRGRGDGAGGASNIYWLDPVRRG